MTAEDIEQITAIVGASEQRTAEVINAAVAASEQRTAGVITAAVAAPEQRTAETVKAAKDSTIEEMRDMQTEILRGIEAFARGNFARTRRFETPDADRNARITALEERVVYLEIRHPCRTAAPITRALRRGSQPPYLRRTS